MPLARPEKRLRNRSLCTYNYPLYPGYLHQKNPSLTKLTHPNINASPMCTKHITSTPTLNQDSPTQIMSQSVYPGYGRYNNRNYYSPYKSHYSPPEQSIEKLPITPEITVTEQDLKRMLSNSYINAAAKRNASKTFICDKADNQKNDHQELFNSCSNTSINDGTNKNTLYATPPVTLSIRSPSPVDGFKRAVFDLISPEVDEENAQSISITSEYSPIVRRPCHLATATLSHSKLETTFSDAISTSAYNEINACSVTICNGQLEHTNQRQSKSRSPTRVHRHHVSRTSDYGSGSSESEHELCAGAQLNTVEEVAGALTTSDVARIVRRVSRFDQKMQRRNTEKSRRRSAPANLRETFSDQVLTVLYADGILKNDDSNIKQLQAVTKISRPESVLELSRKFSRSSAAQNMILARVEKIMQVRDPVSLQKLVGGI